jgi:trk system potassium uptake protein TrkH
MKHRASPYLIIILSFITIIIIGAVILSLPFAVKENVDFSIIDALFTSTSAVCVTGLSPVQDFSADFTIFGKIIIILLVEIGGLGLVTIAIFAFSLLGLKIGVTDRFLIKESLNQNSMKGMVKLVLFAVKTTLIIQLIGAFINFTIIIQHYSFWDSLGMSFFHAISSFNNAGFDIFPGGSSSVLMREHPLLTINTIFLVIIGGIGFIVIDDILNFRKRKKLSLHTKIFEKESWLTSLFTIVSARTFGMQIVHYSNFKLASILLLLIIMFIGASPSSTGGGIKTTTFYTALKSIVAFAIGKRPITHKREIASQSILKAFVVIVISLLYVIITIFLISIVEDNNSLLAENSYEAFSKISFEVVSAYSTTGFTSGILMVLSPFSKILLMVSMFFGRVGLITIISIWNRHWHYEKTDIKYIEERLIIG